MTTHDWNKVIVELDGHVAKLIMNDPPVMNAAGVEMVRGMMDALTLIEKKENGETGLKLNSIADEVRVKPKKEEPKADPVPRKPKKAVAKQAAASKPPAKGADGGKRSLVPQLPRKG